MKLFKRKQSTTEAPAMLPELNDYYQAEKRQQTVITWLLGFATLAVTIAVAFLLFLGGRWVVQKVRNNPNPSTGTAQQGDNADSGEDTTTQTTAPAQTTPEQPVVGSTPTSTTTPAVTAANTPKTSSATTTLPSTGPTETMTVFLVATAAGTFAYKRSIRSRY